MLEVIMLAAKAYLFLMYGFFIYIAVGGIINLIISRCRKDR